MSNHVTHNTSGTGNIFMTILSILLPPLGVALARGIGGTFFLNVLLTLLGYVPGLVHAIWVVARR